MMDRRDQCLVSAHWSDSSRTDLVRNIQSTGLFAPSLVLNMCQRHLVIRLDMHSVA
jgi:hypothetical protein